MSKLREDLDRALDAINIGPPPVERVVRDGRRLRTRRRAAVVAVALAVAAVVAGYPALSHSIAAPPAPVTTHKHHDPVITDSAAPKGAVSGDIAQGTIGQVRWQVRLAPDKDAGAKPGDVCFAGTISTSTNEACGPGPALALDNPPANFAAEGDSTYETTLGRVAADVTYLVLTFTDGQQLKLMPVSYAGQRYVAWASPLSVPIKNVTAHLGSPTSDSGQTETAIPFELPGQIPLFEGSSWYKPGQALPAAASAVVGSGTVDGYPWSATTYVGPGGTCLESVSQPVVSDLHSAYCTRVPPRGTAVFGENSGLKLTVYTLSAAPGVASLRLSFSDGAAVNAKPISVGNQRFVSRAVAKGVALTGWTAYDAAGRAVQSGT